MTKFPRRKFLKTIGSAAVVTALPNVIVGAQSQAPSAALFWEPQLRAIQGPDLTLEMLLQGLKEFTVTTLNERDLIAQLNATRFDLLVTPYGSAFPKRAWPAILKYLLDGGNWLNIGGVPLSRPIVREDLATWRVEPRQTTYHKRSWHHALVSSQHLNVQGCSLRTCNCTFELLQQRARRSRQRWTTRR